MGTACTDEDRGSQDVPSSSTEQFMPAKQRSSPSQSGDMKQEVRRADFDEFQKKWEKFDRDDFIEDMCTREQSPSKAEKEERDFLGRSSLPVLGHAFQSKQELLSSVHRGYKNCTQDPIHAVRDALALVADWWPRACGPK